MEAPFIKDGGLFVLTFALIIVTAWYAYATMKTWRVMKTEFEFKTKPKIGFKPILIIQNDWNSVQTEQNVVNIGIGYFTIAKARMIYKPTNKDNSIVVQCVEKTPVIIAPGDSIGFSFKIEVNELNFFKQSDIDKPSYLLNAEIEYQCKGLDDKEYSFYQTVHFQELP